MEKERKRDIGLMRYAAISPIIAGVPDEYVSMNDFFRKTAEKGILHPDGTIRFYSPNTLAKWYQAYRHDGFEGLEPSDRSDMGHSRKIDGDIAERVKYMKEKYPRLPATAIYRQLIDDGIIIEGDISESTISRFVRLLDICEKEEKDEMRRYERPHINEAWYGDSSVGPYIKTEDGKKHKVYIIALIDDASRFVIGIGAFFNDNFVNMMSVLKSAVSKYGCPYILSFDNGSTYRNKQMELLAARIGVNLHYCKPYTPTQKSKIERWFRTLKDHWLASIDYGDYHSIDEIRASLYEYVNRYNSTVHSSLHGKTPQERFFMEPQKIRRLSQEAIDRSFLLEMTRKVSADCVISVSNTEYEVDYRFAGKKIDLRYTPGMEEIFVVEEDGSLTKIEALNKHDNAKVKRKVRLSEGGE